MTCFSCQHIGFAFFLAVSGTPVLAVPALPITADDWKTHLIDDLLPFWSTTTAAANGSFPGRLCNDGSLPPTGGCDGVTAGQANAPSQTLVGQSRQVFSYAVAFHMTGDTQYLDLATKGEKYLFDTFHDSTSNLFFQTHDVTTGHLGPTISDTFAVEQAYGLLGPSMLYYLTKDADLYSRIQGVESAISTRFRDASTGAYSRAPDTGTASADVFVHLDQINAYMAMMADMAPTPDNAALLQDARQTADYIRTTFHDPVTGMIRKNVSAPTGTLANAHLGFTMKSYWHMDQVALMAQDAELSQFAREEAKRAFRTGFREDVGAWVTDFDSDGNPNGLAEWWSYAEANQFLASIADGDAELEGMLAQTQAFWLEHFVDGERGSGIHPFAQLSDGTGLDTRPKHEQWKAGFHSYEHALISYLGASASLDTDAELFFARSPGDTEFDLAYGFEGIAGVPSIALFDETDGVPDVQRVTFSDVQYGDVSLVPLPAPFWMALSGLAILFGASRPARFSASRVSRAS